MKLLYIEAKPEPWITWDKDLWKESQHLTNKTSDFTITSVKNEADVIMLEYYPGLHYYFDKDIKYVLYVESLTKTESIEMLEICEPIRESVLILSDSISVIDIISDHGFNVIRWNRPTRVPSKLEYDGVNNILEKTGGIVITCNGERKEDNLTEIMKTYFAICLQDSKTTEGELDLLHDVDIFSAQDISFETFNNVTFQGLQPNPKMFKKIKTSKLFISPYRGDGVPLNAIDALILGTPVIVRDTVANRAVFNWNSECFYRDEKELAQKIKFFSEIEISNPDYIRIIDDGYAAVKQSHSVSNSLSSLINILNGG